MGTFGRLMDLCCTSKIAALFSSAPSSRKKGTSLS
jgi:hypothetical protein